MVQTQRLLLVVATECISMGSIDCIVLLNIESYGNKESYVVADLVQ